MFYIAPRNASWANVHAMQHGPHPMYGVYEGDTDRVAQPIRRCSGALLRRNGWYMVEAGRRDLGRPYRYGSGSCVRNRELFLAPSGNIIFAI